MGELHKNEKLLRQLIDGSPLIQSDAQKVSNSVTYFVERIAELEREVRILRQYGNKDCTAMADAALTEEQRTDR